MIAFGVGHLGSEDVHDEVSALRRGSWIVHSVGLCIHLGHHSRLGLLHALTFETDVLRQEGSDVLIEVNGHLSHGIG